jgi:hypothetical protein
MQGKNSVQTVGSAILSYSRNIKGKVQTDKIEGAEDTFQRRDKVTNTLYQTAISFEYLSRKYSSITCIVAAKLTSFVNQQSVFDNTQMWHAL